MQHEPAVWPVRFSTSPRVELTFLMSCGTVSGQNSLVTPHGHALASQPPARCCVCPRMGPRAPVQRPDLYSGASVMRPAGQLVRSAGCGWDNAGRAGCGETLCHSPELPRSSQGSQARPSPTRAAPRRCAALAPIHTGLGSSGCTVTMINLTWGTTQTQKPSRVSLTRPWNRRSRSVSQEPGGLSYNTADPLIPKLK